VKQRTNTKLTKHFHQTLLNRTANYDSFAAHLKLRQDNKGAAIYDRKQHKVLQQF